MFMKVRIDGVLEIEGEIGQDVHEPVLSYVVNDLDGFFGIHDFDESEEDAIRQRFENPEDEDGGLTVFRDGGVAWSNGEELLQGDGELMDEDQFRDEARMAGSVVEE